MDGKESNIFKIVNGQITTKEGERVTTPCMLIDTGCFTCLKIGEFEWIDNYYKEMWQKYCVSGFYEIAESLMLLKFRDIHTYLTTEQICTVLNYFATHSAVPDKLKWFIGCEDKEELSNWIIDINYLGY